MGQPFPYAARAHSAEIARLAVHESSAKWRLDKSERSKEAWLATVQQFHASVDAAYPPHFWSDFEKLRGGDVAGLASAIDFIEADPMFFRSGYVKAQLLSLIKRFPLTTEQVSRLRTAVIRVVHDRDRREFRRYCRLAPYIDGPDFREQLKKIVFPVDRGVERRAKWILEALSRFDRTRSAS